MSYGYLPRTIYAIFPKDENGNIAGVYVGSTFTGLRHRIAVHLGKKSSHQKELHNLMRTNGFVYQSLETRVFPEDFDLEYDWIDYFLKKTNLRVFNKMTKKHQDYRNCCYCRIGGKRKS